jgi:hypothetical protein
MRHVQRRHRRRHSFAVAAVTAAAITAALPLAAHAGPPGCKSITKGTLDVELSAGQRSSRMVRLAKGDTISFSVQGTGATVTLVSGAQAAQVLPAVGGMATYDAPSTATYVFSIEAGRDTKTAVAANCTRPGGDNATLAPGHAKQAVELEITQFETDLSGTRGAAFSLGLSEFAAAADAARAPVDRWGGAGTVFVSTSDDDPEGASAFTLSLYANAEIGPDDLGTVLDRMQRVASAEVVGESEVQAAMASTAVGPDLSFDAAPLQRVAQSVRGSTSARRTHDGQAPEGQAPDGMAQPPAAPQELWVTQLHESRSPDSAVTETAVVRRDVVAGTPLPAPMSLGAVLPADAEADTPAEAETAAAP